MAYHVRTLPYQKRPMQRRACSPYCKRKRGQYRRQPGVRQIRRIPPAGFQPSVPQQQQVQPMQPMQNQARPPQQGHPPRKPPRRPFGMQGAPFVSGSSLIPKATSMVKSTVKNMSAKDMIQLVKLIL